MVPTREREKSINQRVASEWRSVAYFRELKSEDEHRMQNYIVSKSSTNIRIDGYPVRI